MMKKNEIIELKSFNVISSSVSFDGDIIKNVLSGTYRVLKNIIDKENIKNLEQRVGDLFIVHESMVDETKPLHEYEWQEGRSYDMSNDFVEILDPSIPSTMSFEKKLELYDDSMAEVIDNNILFSMLKVDYGYKYNILKEGENIVGFNIDAIGSWINTPDRILIRASRCGNIMKVKHILTSPTLTEHADIHAHNDDAYNLACYYGHVKIIIYLLSGKKLIDHCTVDARNNFINLCIKKIDIMKILILELPKNKIEEITVLISQDEYKKLVPSQNKIIIKEALHVRTLNDKLNIEIINKPSKFNKVKI